MTVGGIHNLKSELKGWLWYQKIRYPQCEEPICYIRLEKPSCLSLGIRMIDGQSPDYTKGLVYNKREVHLAVRHYCRIWPRTGTELSELHGDFSLGNIIYNEEGPHVTDWEHFSLNSAPWGFDPLDLLLETLWFGMRGRLLPNNAEVRNLIENLKLLRSSGNLLPEMIQTPISFIKTFMNNNSRLWGPQYQKFPILQFTVLQAREIEKAIRKAL
jgi:hypothetical protein